MSAIPLNKALAGHIKKLHFGGNWTDVNLQFLVSDVSLKEATMQFMGLNTIAQLVYHINYFIEANIDVLEGRELTASDKFSFNCPVLVSEADWQALVKNSLDKANRYAQLVEAMPEEQLWEDFWDSKYGTYYFNIQGIIEHSHYHLGQIGLIKKMLRQEDS